MRNSSFTLQIPQPCAESWADMTPQGAGRHCASCQQVVIDFTQKTDAEILAIVGAAAGGSLCGRLTVSQLNRPLLRPAAPRPGWWSTAVAATVALLAGRTLTAPPARAQSPHAQHPGRGQHSTEPEFRPAHPAAAALPAALTQGKVVEVAPTDTARTQVSGQVVDAQGQGLPGVTVLLQGTQHGVSTSADGSFTLPIEPQEQQCALSFHSIGYVVQAVAQPRDNQPVRVVLQADLRQLGGVMVVGGMAYAPVYTPRGAWSRLRRLPYQISRLFH